MSRCRSVYLRGVVVLLSVTLPTLAAGAGDFAAEGAEGTLEVDVRVEGGGAEQAQPGAGWTSVSWTAHHQAKLTIALTAMAPLVDASPFEGMGSGTDEPQEAEDESDWEEEWDARLEACGGDEICEMQVTMQKMADPRAQALIQQAMMGAAAVGSGTASLDPSIQMWAFPSGGIAGTVRMEQTEDTFGVVSESGGGLIDVHCISNGEENLETTPAGPGAVHPVLTINVRDSSYELRIPAEEPSLRLTTRCDNGVEEQTAQSRGLLGMRPVNEPDWGAALTVKGSILAGDDQPRMCGKKVLESDLSLYGGPEAARVVKVTIDWKFGPGPKFVPHPSDECP